MAADQLDVIVITETTSITEETTATLSDAAGDAPVQTTPDVEQIVTLLSEDEPDQSSGGNLGAYYRKILTLKSYLICLVTMVISVRTTFRTKAITEQHFLSALSYLNYR